jgi:predicted nucleic acid-binding protein
VPPVALFDSNILIDYMLGRPAAAETIRGCDDRSISVVTSIELLAGATEADWKPVSALLDLFEELPLDREVRDEAARVRRVRRLKLPDAIILATARIHRLPLVTRNTRDFPEDDPGIIVPYALS